MSFAIIKVMRVKTRADLAGLTAHGRRMDRSPHVDRSRSHLNHHWSPPALELNDPSDLVEAVDAVIAKAGAKTHRGSAVAADFHLGASPGFFEQEDGSWDYDRIGSWYKANRRAMMERFPGMIASVRLDLDESSPHIAVCLVPLAAKTTKHGSGTVVSFRKLLGGASKAEASSRMIELQDWYAEQMRPLGLRRGIPKIVTGRVGLSHQQYRRLREIEDARRLGATARAEAAARDAELKLQELERQLAAVRRERRCLAKLGEHMQSIGDLQDMFAAPAVEIEADLQNCIELPATRGQRL